MTEAVIFGAGSVGRGFLGQLFSESGYEVMFVDIDASLIAALNRQGCYTLHLVTNTSHESIQVGPVRGLLSSEEKAVIEALTLAPLGATAVGARALPAIAPLIARGIRERKQRHILQPLNLIVCENLPDAAGYLRGLIHMHLTGEERAFMSEYVGLANAVIARMVPAPTPALRAQDPTAIITEPYKELPVDREGFVGEIPAVVGIIPCAPFAPYIARKLYLHNAAHAVMGYLGYQRGHPWGYQALEDPLLEPIVRGALEEGIQGLVARYAMDKEALCTHVAQLWERLGNRALADPVQRLARDPLRKLAPEDRLVGAARLAQAAGAEPANLAWGIAGALAYDAPSDAEAQVLQSRLGQEGLEAVLAAVCGIMPEEPLGDLVRRRYRALRQGEWNL